MGGLPLVRRAAMAPAVAGPRRSRTPVRQIDADTQKSRHRSRPRLQTTQTHRHAQRQERSELLGHDPPRRTKDGSVTLTPAQLSMLLEGTSEYLPSAKSSCLGVLPRLARAEHAVEDDEQLSHDGGDNNLEG